MKNILSLSMTENLKTKKRLLENIQIKTPNSLLEDGILMI